MSCVGSSLAGFMLENGFSGLLVSQELISL